MNKFNKEVMMKSHTYYDVLGVSRDATLEERKYIIPMQMYIKT